MRLKDGDDKPVYVFCFVFLLNDNQKQKENPFKIIIAKDDHGSHLPCSYFG